MARLIRLAWLILPEEKSRSLALRFILFEELSRFFEREGVAVDDELVGAGVLRDGDDVADSMAVLAKGLDDQIDVYHG
jgi:hypothetical protein